MTTPDHMRNGYRSLSRGGYNKVGQSRQFSNLTASTQRDTAAVKLKQGFVILPRFENGTAKFAFSPLVNIFMTQQLEAHARLHDQFRISGYEMKIMPDLPNAQEQYAMFYRWMRDDVPFG